MRPWLEALLLVALLALGGCAGETFAPDAAPEFAVTAERAPFFRLGPQQAMAPDACLARGDRLRLLRREFGYSFALLPGGETGYVANDAIDPVPAAESILPLPEVNPAPRAPVEEPLPKPDLGETPADGPAF